MNEKKKHVVIALIVGMTVFIWSNSMLSRQESAQMSGGLMAWLDLCGFAVGFWVLQALVWLIRKCKRT